MTANPMFSSLQEALLVECSRDIVPYSLCSSFNGEEGVLQKDQELRVSISDSAYEFCNYKSLISCIYFLKVSLNCGVCIFRIHSRLFGELTP